MEQYYWLLTINQLLPYQTGLTWLWEVMLVWVWLKPQTRMCRWHWVECEVMWVWSSYAELMLLSFIARSPESVDKPVAEVACRQVICAAVCACLHTHTHTHTHTHILLSNTHILVNTHAHTHTPVQPILAELSNCPSYLPQLNLM